MTRMRAPSFLATAMAVVLAGCAGLSTIKPAEVLDEQTGVTVGALQEPIEFVEGAQNASLAATKRASFAYLGPVEWDRMGDITYGLWIHVAPGNDRQIGDLQAAGAVTLELDDGPLVLAKMPPPGDGHGPYRPVVSWGQTGYFALDVDRLKRVAGSHKLVLAFRTDDGPVEFQPSQDTRTTLLQFVRARGIIDD